MVTSEIVASQRAARQQVFGEVEFERVRQDEQWGGPDHDDRLPWFEWADRIATQVRGLIEEARSSTKPSEPPDDFRDRMLKVAAIAVASVESFDRKARGPDLHGCMGNPCIICSPGGTR